MSAVLGHEQRNPIAAVKGMAQILLERLPQDSREAQQATTILHEATHLTDLTNHILAYARTGQIHPSRVHVDDLIARALQLAEAEDRAVVHLAPDLPPFTVDRQKMEQVLVNVIDNALKADPTGPIEIIGRLDHGALELQIRDAGPGIDPTVARRMFEPFVTGRAQGTGLGLALCRRIVEDHGGTIRGENRQEGGARIVIRVPHAQPGMEEEQ
jgi:two-component system sensor histidine kinase HydH